MKIRITYFDTITGDVIDRIDTDLHRYCEENNTPAQYVIREEIRTIGAYITQGNNVRTEVTKQ